MKNKKARISLVKKKDQEKRSQATAKKRQRMLNLEKLDEVIEEYEVEKKQVKRKAEIKSTIKATKRPNIS